MTAAPARLAPSALSGTAALDVPLRIRGRQVDYAGREGRAVFTGEVVVVRASSTLWADRLETLRGTEEATASGHVRFTDTERLLVLTCDTLRYANGLRQVAASGGCRMVTGVGPDATTVTADEMEVFVEKREATARGDVRILQAGSEALCREAHLYGAEDRAVLTGRPVLRRPPHEFECDEATTWFKEGRSLLRGAVRGRLVPERLDRLTPGTGTP